MPLPLWLIVLTLLALLHPVRSQSGNGIIGFGISLWPDLCCQACHDSLSSLYLNCTTFDSSDDTSSSSDMDMSSTDMAMGTTSDACYASNKPWLQTMAYCIAQQCTLRGYPADQQAACFSNQAVAGAASPTFAESLPPTPPTVELDADATWLNETSLVNAELYEETYGTYYEFRLSEYLHPLYSMILYLVTIGIIVLCGVAAQLSSIFPTLQKPILASKPLAQLRATLTLPALFGTRHLEPLPGRLGYVPSRPLSLFIALYIVLNIVFSSVSFGSFQPNLYFYSQGFELCEYVGNRTGTLSLVNASMAILFAGRNNLLIFLTGWSQSTFLALHRWAARVAAVQAVVHSIVYTLAYWQPGYDGAVAYAAKAAEPFYYWGIVATICFALLCALAVLPLRAAAYEIFLVLHIALAVVALVGCWYHLVPHFTYAYGYQTWLFICFGFWAFDRLVRLLRLGVYNRLGRARARLESVPGADVVQLTVYPQTAWGFGAPGQHSFLYFPGVGRVWEWENHPFSVAGWSKGGKAKAKAPTASQAGSDDDRHVHDVAITPAHDGPSVTFLIRAHAGATRWLQRTVLAGSRAAPGGVEISAYTEGPYGGHRAAHASLAVADTVVCVAGGIGITGALGYVQAYTDAAHAGETAAGRTKGPMGRATRFILVWSAREAGLIEYVRRNFLDEERVECAFWCTGGGGEQAVVKKEEDAVDGGGGVGGLEGMTRGRMVLETVIRGYLETGRQTTVLVCGPGQMADEAAAQVVKAVKDGFKVGLIEEAFAW